MRMIPRFEILAVWVSLGVFGCFRAAPEPRLSLAPPPVLLHENFDDPSAEGLAPVLLSDPHITWAEGLGLGGSAAIRVAYVGSEIGSERVGARYPLSVSTDRATLSFDVRFDEDFQWVRGGKLHGLGPKYPITGGRERRPKGWSARMMFTRGGRCSSYLYDQDQSQKWGIGRLSRAPVFVAGRWHHVVLQLRLNQPGEADGSVRFLVDGREVVEQGEVVFRGQGGPDTLIQTFLFSTFHGGATPTWTPRKNGAPTTVYAFFDNFLVTEGARES